MDDGTVIKLVTGAALLAVGSIVGALLERSRARSGYLAKQFRDHVVMLLDFTYSASSDELRQRINENRPSIEADALLFGGKRAKDELYSFHESLNDGAVDVPSIEIRNLAKTLRGRWYRRLAPQKRWFK